MSLDTNASNIKSLELWTLTVPLVLLNFTKNLTVTVHLIQFLITIGTNGYSLSLDGSRRVSSSNTGCWLKTGKWAGSRRGAGTFSEHCRGAFEQGVEPSNAQSACPGQLSFTVKWVKCFFFFLKVQVGIIQPLQAFPLLPPNIITLFLS